MIIKFKKIHPAAILPSGEDNTIYSPISCTIRSQDYVLIHTGLVPKIPQGFKLLIEPRYSLAKKSHVIAFPGVIRSRSNEEIIVMLINLSVIPYKVNEGDPIAQLALTQDLFFQTCFDSELDIETSFSYAQQAIGRVSGD